MNLQSWERFLTDENSCMHSAPTELQSVASLDDKQRVFMCMGRESGGRVGRSAAASVNSVGKRMHHGDK